MSIRSALLVTDVVLASALVAGVVFSGGKDRLSRILFVLLTIIFTYMHLMAYVSMKGVTDASTVGHLYGTFRPLGFLIGPLVYFYVRSAINPHLRFRRFDLLHLLPAVVSFIELLPTYFYSLDEKILLINSAQAITQTRIRFASMVGLSLVYLIFSINTLIDYERSLRQQYSCIEHWVVGWLKACLASSFLIWLICLGHAVDGISPKEEPFISIAFCLSTYILLITALRRSMLFNRGAMLPELTAGLPLLDQEEFIDKQCMLQACGLNEESFKEYFTKIKSAIEDQHLYRKSRLRLRDLAEVTNTPEYLTSQVVNTGFGMSFFDTINKYRVEEAKLLLKSNHKADKQIIEVAYEVGFNSKSAFNNAFKKFTGQTPTLFREETLEG
jgi:AraC-like DNA-binding protein